MITNQLLGFFEVNSHEELLTFMKQNPDDQRVQALQQLLKALIIPGAAKQAVTE